MTRPGEPWGTGTRPDAERLQDQIAALRHRLETAESVEDDLESSRQENRRLATTLQVLKTELFERVTEVDRLRDQLDTARREFEAERQSFASRIDGLEGGLAGVRAERDRALAQGTRLQVEYDRCAERESQWERTLGETECRHRSEIDDLAHELRIASTQASQAAHREHALNEQFQIAQHDLDATRAERNRLADELVLARRGLHAIDDQQRDLGDPLQSALQDARRWEEFAVERETELLGQIHELRGALDLHERQLEEQRSAHQEESIALACELEAMFRDQMADGFLRTAELQKQLESRRAELEPRRRHSGDGPEEVDESFGVPARDFDTEFDPHPTDECDPRLVLAGEGASEETARDLGELARLQEQVEILKQQRDDAMEQAGMLRVDRDRIFGCLARLEARLQEVEEENRTDVFRRASESADVQRELEAATERERDRDRRAHLDSIETPGIRPCADAPAHRTEPTIDDRDTAGSEEEPAQAPLVTASAQPSPEPADSHRRDNEDPTPAEPVRDTSLCEDQGSAVKAEPEPDRIAAPRPLAAESPEARILHLRNSLRVAHEARANGPFGGPFFSRLARIWRRSGAEQ